MQGLQGRVVFPKGINRSYRDVTAYIDSYTLEETSNLIWIGCLVARMAPAGFQRLWGHLQPALQHYIYGTDASKAAMRAAAEHMRKYAEELEKLVIDGWVRLTAM